MHKAIVNELQKLDKLNTKLAQAHTAVGAAKRNHQQTGSILEVAKAAGTAAEHTIEAAEAALSVTVRKILADETKGTGKVSSGKTLDPRIIAELRRQEKAYNLNDEAAEDRLYEAEEKHQASTAALNKAAEAVSDVEDAIRTQTQTLSIVVRNMFVENGGEF